ncbi:phage tail tape measure protein [Cereibacter azotoformans]|nr:phage tail tape measure protein [Cereibacter azotoformans]AXQ93237.1 phage tail tape measure protein [Cereibacter sphaeroides]MBO4169103.1 phage tail tape measure protein [Cereibacter azotoformans]UIJ31552.1 phage tail tape measure protein [Cereibacter azotoformans]
MADIETLEEQVAALEATLGNAAGMTATFEAELARMRDSMVFTGREVDRLSSGVGTGLRRAFDGVLFDGMKLSDAMEGLAQSISRTVYSIAMKPVQDAVSGFVANGLNSVLGGLLPFAKGAAFAQGRVMAFARGGVVAGATPFAMRGGTGIMGEAGPEAILPLARGTDGRLGVQAGGGRAVQVVMNVATPDVQGFERSRGQIAAQVSRMLSRGQRNG